MNEVSKYTGLTAREGFVRVHIKSPETGRETTVSIQEELAARYGEWIRKQHPGTLFKENIQSIADEVYSSMTPGTKSSLSRAIQFRILEIISSSR